MNWGDIVILFVVGMGILTILLGGLKENPSHFPDTQSEQNKTKNKPED